MHRPGVPRSLLRARGRQGPPRYAASCALTADVAGARGQRRRSSHHRRHRRADRSALLRARPRASHRGAPRTRPSRRRGEAQRRRKGCRATANSSGPCGRWRKRRPRPLGPAERSTSTTIPNDICRPLSGRGRPRRSCSGRARARDRVGACRIRPRRRPRRRRRDGLDGLNGPLGSPRLPLVQHGGLQRARWKPELGHCLYRPVHRLRVPAGSGASRWPSRKAIARHPRPLYCRPATRCTQARHGTWLRARIRRCRSCPPIFVVVDVELGGR